VVCARAGCGVGSDTIGLAWVGFGWVGLVVIEVEGDEGEGIEAEMVNIPTMLTNAVGKKKKKKKVGSFSIRGIRRDAHFSF
jgi:hypothetical protein